MPPMSDAEYREFVTAGTRTAKWATTRRDGVHADREGHVPVAQSQQLGGGQTLLLHGAAGVLEAQHHLVLRRGEAEDRGDLLPQPGHPGGAQVAVEVQNEQ